MHEIETDHCSINRDQYNIYYKLEFLNILHFNDVVDHLNFWIIY